MRTPQRHAVALAITALYSNTGHAQQVVAPAVEQLDAVQVTGQKLDAARNGLSPDTGSTIYRFDQKDIQALPLGTSTPLNQLILQAPGVVQDSYGQLHVRGDHSNLQYRINGVVIPEAISGFGQSLDTHFADDINILTGALPAQYGYRTAGIVDIRTRGTGFGNQDGSGVGSVTVLGGSRGDGEASLEYSGTSGGWSYFLTGSFLRNDIGIENPTSARDAIHDTTKQQKAFGYLSRVIDENSRVSLMIGTSNNRFEIPNVPGQTPVYDLAGSPAVDSSNLNARQNEKNTFEILTYQASPAEKIDYQVSAFHRYTDVAYQPDPLGDLVYDGIASQVLRRNDAVGLQGDLAFHVNDAHTIRTGLFAQRERFSVDNASSVFAADADGNQTGTTPFTIVDDSRQSGVTYGVYLQDEWQPIKSLTVNYGTRFDHVSTVTNEKQWSPRFGLVYDLTRDTRVHFGYARYFTPPPTEKIDTTSVAKFVGTTNALPSDADTSVRSERSNYFDIGVSHQLLPSLTVGVDAFYRKVRDLQDEGQFGNALIYSAFNYGQGRVKGIEFSANYRKDPLTVYGNVSVSQAEGRGIATGQFNFGPAELAYIASHWVHLDHDQTLTASAGASYLLYGTHVGGDLLFGSGLRNGFANTGHLPAYLQVNLSASRTFTTAYTGKVEARVAIINLFDRVYELRDGSGIGVGAPQYGPRRGFFGGVTKYF
jgi:outer membrane receptor protein involved in Fe transport